MKFDCELATKDVQDLANADAVAAFFARLGYHTDSRTEQTAANLGITAEGAARPIERIELIADQEGLLQVYLFEVKSVTVTHIRALARAFRNRAGNYLLVLTSDYERLDFVLVEKYLPSAAAEAKTIGQRQVAVRPRMLTVERRKPARVHLRVLRRFTYTEADPLAQYDKLLSAYTVAEWSEEFFNNRALFSDYYLLERLRDRAEWGEDPKPAYVRLRELYQEAASHFAGGPEERLRSELLEPLFESLGFALKRGKQAKSAATEPDYRLLAPESENGALAVCLAYPWGRSLDGKDPERDKETPEENPNFVVVSLLERKEAPWAVVTNGKMWRLYGARAHSRATNYYEVDLEEALAVGGPHAGSPADAFRYFWLLFRRQAFEPQAVTREGKEQRLCFLDLLLAESEDYAKELGERLKDRVFGEIFPHLAEGFIAHIRQKEGADTELPQERLDAIFQGVLTLLYRLLFLLYAESRGLLPVRETRGYFEVSLTKLKGEIAEAAGTIADEVDGKLKRSYKDDSCALYDRLMRLFGAVDQGDEKVNVPTYNGGLFITKPADDDETPEAESARFLNAHKVPDRYLARAIDLMARDPDPKRQDLVFLDYKSLGVRHLGSIYEGLLEFKLRIAPEKLGVKKEKGREIYVPFGDLTDREKARAEREGNVVSKGHPYLENDKRERKATGSYYTPDYIVDYIVEHTVGPVLEEKFEAARPLLRKAQEKRRAWLKQQEQMRKLGRPDAQGERIGVKEVVQTLFNIKVLDPAMGSGHFLVEAVDFITDRMLDFLNAFPWNPVRAYLEETREAILEDVERQGISIDRAKLTDVNLLKRHILKRCIYGVDLNPMAVELAKVSLWLDCFTLGAPLSFLDHHIRCGNSLIGSTIEEVKSTVGQILWGDQFAGLLSATNRMKHVGELSDVTPDQVQESRREYGLAADALARFKHILDVFTSRWFGNEPQRAQKRAGHGFDPAVEFLASPECIVWAKNPEATDGLSDWDKKVVERALASAEERRFFHWELEFPEVFYGRSAASEQKIERVEGAGFDVVIGNPPWGADLNKVWCKQQFVSAGTGIIDSFAVFTELGLGQLRPDGQLGMLLPDILLLKNYPQIRHFLLTRTSIGSLVHWGMPFPEVNLDVCSLVACNRSPDGRHQVLCVPAVVGNAPELSPVNRISQTTFLINTQYRFNLGLSESVLSLLESARHLGPTVGELFVIREGVHSGNVRNRLFLDEPAGKKCQRMFFGRDEISPLKMTWGGKWIQLDPKAFDRDAGDYFNIGDENLHKSRKILVRRTGDRIIAALDTEGFYASNNFFLCVPKEGTTWDQAVFVAMYLNSRFATWYFRTIQPRTNRLFAELKITHLSEIPVPFVSEPELSDWVAGVAQRVRAATSSGSPEARAQEIAEFDRELERRLGAIDRVLAETAMQGD